MESATAAPQLPPQAVVMQMVMGGWIARTISEVSRLDVPDALQRGGPMTAAALVAGGVPRGRRRARARSSRVGERRLFQ